MRNELYELETAISYLETCGFEYDRQGPNWVNHFSKDGIDYFLPNMEVIKHRVDETTPEGGE
jgi:hypothetical protein